MDDRSLEAKAAGRPDVRGAMRGTAWDCVGPEREPNMLYIIRSVILCRFRKSALFCLYPVQKCQILTFCQANWGFLRFLGDLGGFRGFRK